jgi:hypothetical protein
MSITSNVLLAIGLPSSRTRGRLLLLDGQVHHDTHVIPKGNYVSGVGNYVSVTRSNVENYVSADNGVRLTGASSVAVTRYRYRGSKIPTPWTPQPTAVS